MILLSSVFWAIALVVVLGSVVLSVVALRIKQPILGLVGLVPIVLGFLVLALGIQLGLPPVLPALVGFALAALAVVGGNPITVWVLGLATSTNPGDGIHGGILVPDTTAVGTKSTTKTREVLRGGTWIGYLERFAVVGSIAVGHFEIIAAVIAIKGLGRFSELDTPETRERFIIGTLTSMIWAGLCGALIILPRLVP